jgi:N-acetylmuramoyl-L-alanine amidase
VSSRRRTLLLVLLGVVLVGVERPAGLGDVLDVRHWSYPDYTRVVIELDRPVEPDVHRLPADPAAGRPERLYLDLAGVWVGRDYAEGIPVDDGLLQAVRLGQNTLRKTRVVIDLERYDRHRLLELSHPHRVVIDVYGHRGAGGGGGRAGNGASPSNGLPAALRPIRKVVIDAGHGGRDPGAIGVGGLREKDVTLRIAKSLGSSLQEKGFEVAYTRKNDRTMTLEERTAIAESVGGDLFVSVHVNAAPRRSVHGIETYQSRRLAEVLHEQVVRGLPRRLRPQDLGVKKGPFYVLFLSNMPAVLVEVGFLTNRGEARRLRDAGYLQALAEQMAVGLDLYRGEQDTRLARRSEE